MAFLQRKKLGNWTVFAVSVVLSLGTLSTTAFSQELDDTSSGDSLVSSAVAQTDETYSVSPILSAYEGADVFYDVKREMRAYPCISYVMNKGLMVGMDQGGFAPSASMSRGQFAYLLYKMEGMPKTTAVSSFSDVDPNAYYADALSWAVSEALFAGYGNQTVQPESSISREGNGCHLVPLCPKQGV